VHSEKKKKKLLQKNYGPDLQLVNQDMEIQHPFKTCPLVFLLCNFLGPHKKYTYRYICFNLSLNCHFCLSFFSFYKFLLCSCQQRIWWYMAGWDDYNTGPHLVRTPSALRASV